MSTLSTTGQFVVTGLTSEKAAREEENNVFDYPIGIASTAVNKYQLVSKELDLELLANVQSTVDQINSKKQEAIDLGLTALGPFKPGVFPPICSFYSDSGSVNNNISSGNETDSAVEGGTGAGTTTPAVSYSIVRKDALRIRRYPYLENRQAPNDNALQGLKFPILNSGNVGQGEENIWFENSKYTEGGSVTYYVTTDEGDYSTVGFDGESGDVLGRYYPVDPTGTAGTSSISIPGELSNGFIFVPEDGYTGISSYLTGIQTSNWYSYSPGIGTVPCEWNTDTGELVDLGLSFFQLTAGLGELTVSIGNICAGIASAQQDALDEIDTLRVGIQTWFVSANTTKQRKHGAQLELWSAERVKIRNNEETNGSNDFARDISEAIPATEAADPNLPTNNNTADREGITADTTEITADSK